MFKEKLLLCAGRSRHPELFTVDMEPQFEPDLVATLPAFKLGKIRPEPWQQVSLIHGIEHFTAREAQELVTDIFSVLANGGKLILEQPNLESAAKALLGMESYTGHWEQDCLWAIYGDPSQDRFPGMGHKFGYTPAMLTQLLMVCGFKKENIQVLPAKAHVPGRDFRIEATK